MEIPVGSIYLMKSLHIKYRTALCTRVCRETRQNSF